MWRRIFLARVAMLCGAVAASGCTTSLPPMSHAHIGHSLTAWRDTPGEQGLFVVAETELASAVTHARSAQNSAAEPAVARAHLRNALHSLNPDLAPRGVGGDYGALRALQGSIDHVEFAATTEDASNNVKQSSAAFSEHAGVLLEYLGDTALLTEQALGAASNDILSEDIEVLVARLDHALEGSDLDGDGAIGSHPSESGMRQLRGRLSDMVSAESPAYEPVGKRYLFGLVRLPGGDWAYRFDRSGEGESSGGY